MVHVSQKDARFSNGKFPDLLIDDNEGNMIENFDLS